MSQTRSKYGNDRVTADGLKFASKAEAARYRDLKYRVLLGEISNLRCQVRYPLHVNGQRIGTYVADFQYTEDGREVVEDVKGVRTAMFIRSKKHMLAEYGIDVSEVQA